MIEVGNVVKSRYRMANHVARIGLVVKIGGSKSDLAQIYWPHSRSTGWVKCVDMEVVSENR